MYCIKYPHTHPLLGINVRIKSQGICGAAPAQVQQQRRRL